MAAATSGQAEQARERGQLLDGAGTLAVRGDDQWSLSRQHETCGQACSGQRLAAAGRSGQQQRRVMCAEGQLRKAEHPGALTVQRAFAKRVGEAGRDAMPGKRSSETRGLRTAKTGHRRREVG